MSTWTGTEIADGGNAPAAAAPLTRKALSSLHRRMGALLFVGLGLLAGFVVAVTFVSTASDDLRTAGGTTTGTVIAWHPDTGHSSGHAEVRYSVASRTHVETVDLGADADNYREGQQVTVYYDRSDPTRMTIDNEDNQPQWSVWAMILTLVGGGAAVLAGFWSWVRWRLIRRVLRAGSWQPITVWVEEYRKAFLLHTSDAGLWHPAGNPPRCPWPRSAWAATGAAPETTTGSPWQSGWWVVRGNRAVFSADQSRPLLLAGRRRP